ncbi:hypothetical protein MKW94_030453, partial [Papaver nudicaule]|nr:hypothetical protein [Papaver nudicaule]
LVVRNRPNMDSMYANAIEEPIMKMDDKYTKIMIPICHGDKHGDHWSLLVYEIEH